jgi:diphthamide biosynthesis methyltransferase
LKKIQKNAKKGLHSAVFCDIMFKHYEYHYEWDSVQICVDVIGGYP